VLSIMSVSLSQVSFEHHREALGIAESQPRISWRFEGNVVNWEQMSYDLEIERDLNGVPSVYSVNSTDSIYVPWPAEALTSAEAAQVRVRAHGLEGQPSTDWSEWTSVETGLLNASDWGNAVPISAARETEADAPKRPVHFRNDFSIDGNISRARLYITALGLYDAEINGKRVGDRVLAPGWQSYNYRHVYDTYDVTELVSSGDNAIGATVGEGWYAGRLGFGGGTRNIYGDTLGLLALLVVTTEDGRKHSVATNNDWHASLGPTVTSEIYDGEKYDARLELDEGWSSPGYDDGEWMAVKQLPPLKGALVPADGPPVRKVEETKPVSFQTSPSGKTIVDFGQNLVGWLRLNVTGQAGTNISLHHAEVLENGELSLRPLRGATAADTLILADDQPKIWEPRFTFHGFRYAQLDGFDPASTENAVTAIVVHSDMEQTGWFECSNPLLNKFHSNVRWSMK
jgi:alpha-L-rhamnosidase